MTAVLHRAIAAHQSGNLTEAEKLYREVLASKPDEADALALLGVALDAKGDFAQAIECIERAVRLDPNAALFRMHLGNALMNAGRFADAAAAFRHAIRLQPPLAEAHYNLGNALRKSGDWAGAVAAYRQAVGCNPAYAEARNNLALALVHENQSAEAQREAEATVAADADYGEGWLTLCNVAEQAKDYKVAHNAGERVIKLMPDDHRAWFGYGVSLNRLGRHEEALEAYQHALKLKPERADIWDNLGQTYQSLNRLEEAEAAFRKTVDVAGQLIDDDGKREVYEEEYGNRHWHLALIELLRGKYKEGFARYRARFKDIGDLKRPDFPQPLWRGENLKGKTILVSDEQGFGDTLMFCRYLPLIKKQGGRVIFAVHPALEPLFKGWAGADRVVVHGENFSGFDYHATTFDLPHRFGTTLETVPADVPYLPLPELNEVSQLPSPSIRSLALANGSPSPAMRERVPSVSEAGEGLLKVGVVWGGSPIHKNDSNRSIPLQVFTALFEEKNTQFYSLNRDMKPGDAELLPRLPLIDLAPRIKNFADAARFMRQMDLIITCDTATAHLAGGLGRPVWTLLPFAPDWRWMLGRDDSPWYPAMRLFRQAKAGDWADVMERVKKVLGAWAGAKD